MHIHGVVFNYNQTRLYVYFKEKESICCRILLYVLHEKITERLKLSFNKSNNIVSGMNFHKTNVMSEKFSMFLVTRSNLGVVEHNFFLVFRLQEHKYSYVPRIWLLGYNG